MDGWTVYMQLSHLHSLTLAACPQPFCKPMPRLPWKQDASHMSQWFVIWRQSTSVQLRKALGLCQEVFTPWMTLALSLSWCTASSTFTKGYLGELGSSPAVVESSSYPTLLGLCSASWSLPLSTTYIHILCPPRAEFEKNKLDIWLCWATCPGSTNSTQLLQKHACVSVAFTWMAESAWSWESGFEGPSSSHSKLNPLAQPFGSWPKEG